MSSRQITVSLLGQLRNAVRVIEQLRDEVRDQADWNEDRDENDPAGSADYYAFALAEVADHIEGVNKGEHSVEDFCDFYGICSLAPAPETPGAARPATPQPKGGAHA